MKRFSPGLIIVILLLLFFGVSLLIRVALPYGDVFGGQLIKETSVDGYYYMRLVDNMVHNFPHYTAFDPFHIYPGGEAIDHLGLFYQLLAGFIWLIGLGHPGQHLVDVVGALFAPFLAALTIIPVYFIGRTLFNKWAGLIAAALMAVLPGEYLGRSILGFADTPVIETFLTAAAMACLLLALKTAADRKLGFDHLLKLDRAVFLRPVVYSLLAGVFLGVYMATWNGGLLFVFIIMLYLAAQFIIDHLAGRSTEHLGIVGSVLFLVTVIFYLPGYQETFILTAAVVAVFIPAFMAVVSRYMAGRGLRPAYYPLAVFGLAVVLAGVVFVISSRTLELMFLAFRIFDPVGSTAATTMEMQPFLSPTGTFSTIVAWGNFTTGFFLFPPDWSILSFVPGFAFIALGVLVYLYFKRRGEDRLHLLFFIWTVVLLVLTLVQRRFAYYFVVNVALLTAWLCWQVVWRYSLSKLMDRTDKAPEEARSKRHRRRRAGPGVGGYRVITGTVAALVFLVVFLPNIIKAEELADVPAYAPTDAWLEALVWMKDNTPEPLGSPEAYYELYDVDYVYPASAYGVTSWWDYGYWITRIAHRIPSANPSQEPGAITNVARLFLATDEAAAEKIAGALQTKYIVADYPTATAKFWAIATWVGESPDKYLPTYYVQQGNNLVAAQLFTPEYYRTTYVRLYNFGGRAVTDVRPVVIAYQTIDREGASLRVVTGSQSFDSYQAAADFVQQEGPDTHVIVGTNPLLSPVPLEAVTDFSLVFSSTQGVNVSGAGSIPEVRVFQYNGP
jgi:dolichyl-phosphooligosaccharide-protein glycotransferase